MVCASKATGNPRAHHAAQTQFTALHDNARPPAHEHSYAHGCWPSDGFLLFRGVFGLVWAGPVQGAKPLWEMGAEISAVLEEQHCQTLLWFLWRMPVGNLSRKERVTAKVWAHPPGRSVRGHRRCLAGAAHNDPPNIAQSVCPPQPNSPVGGGAAERATLHSCLTVCCLA